MKSSDEEPALAPGSGGSGQDLLAMQTGKASPTASSTAAADGFPSSTWSFNPSGSVGDSGWNNPSRRFDFGLQRNG